MADLTYESASIVEITAAEVEKYAGHSDTSTLYPILDEKRKTYTVIVVENDRSEGSAWVVVMARVVGDYVVIEEDTTLEKHLFEALMVNGGIPREKIVLAYQGETLPE